MPLMCGKWMPLMCGKWIKYLRNGINMLKMI